MPPENKTDMTETHERPYDDEIDLVELAASLWGQKWVILGVMTLCIALGVVYALVRTPVYEYATTIEIGTRLVAGEPAPIEPPQSVVAKLEKNYIPEAIRTFESDLQTNGGEQRSLSVNTNSPSDTNLVVLTSESSEEFGKYYIPLHNRVLQRLARDHEREAKMERVRLENQLEEARRSLEELQDERILKVERSELETELSTAKNKLAQLKDQEELLKSEIENLDVQEEIVRKRLEELSGFVDQARSRRGEARQQVESGTDSMALMLIDNELQRDIDRQTELEERLLVKLPENRASLRSQLEDNQRQQTLQQEKIAALEARYEKLLLDQERRIPPAEARIAELETQLENLRNTQAVLPPQRSLKPVGTSGKVIVALSVILGGMLGLFAALGTMFFRSVREKLKSER